MGKMCTACQKHATKNGVYGWDTSDAMETGQMILGATGGYVAASTIDQQVTYLKTNPKTGGLVWLGGALALGAFVPEITESTMGRGALVGIGVYGAKVLIKSYNLLSNINGFQTEDWSAKYSQEMADLAAARMQDYSLPTGGEAVANPLKSSVYNRTGAAAYGA